MSKITKGSVVKWTQEDQKGKMSFTREQWENLLKNGDIGIVLGKDDSRKKPHYFVYWQRLGKQRSMFFRDLHIIKSLTESE